MATHQSTRLSIWCSVLARYRYFTVPHAVFDGLFAAESKGAYFNLNIRDRFPYERLA